MRISLTSVCVDDQAEALAFYTENPTETHSSPTAFPWLGLDVDDVETEYERLCALGGRDPGRRPTPAAT
jgi:hypothetical protein